MTPTAIPAGNCTWENTTQLLDSSLKKYNVQFSLIANYKSVVGANKTSFICHVKLQIAGLNTGYDRVVARKVGAARSFWYFAGDQLLAVDAINAPRDYMVGKRLIEAGKSPAPEVLADPETDMKALLKP